MKIVNLIVENFRAINRVELRDLQEMIVIAGPNGCGKSCILDAIRLFKSVYGGYQPNEWHQWLGEFQINFQRNPQQMASLLKDRTQSSVIEAYIELADEERSFITENLHPLLETLIWNTHLPGARGQGRAGSALAAEVRTYQPVVAQKIKELLPAVQAQIQESSIRGRLEIHPDGNATTVNNILLELVFSSFHPKRIGVIDFHGAHRNYGREQLGGINLSLDQEEDRIKTTSLYNYANKYSNVKSQMAAEYVKQALKEKRDESSSLPDASQSLAETLQELFAIFFPDKKFLGPVPTEDGMLDFPVEVADKSIHDMNDLSSGEKEILFGYLRLRNSASRFSVILLDEPELHLNPALVRGLPQFYYKHMGLELENQIWLVTHSDAFLREAVGHAGIRVFHMQHASVSGTTTNQMHEIQHGEEIESILLEMVGNLAAYRPGAKVVFFEGEDSEFDLNMVSRLFPAIENEINLVSGGNRFRVETLHRILERSLEVGDIPVKIYSVVDKDSGPQIIPAANGGRHFSWDVYHIENYLLEPSYIHEALERLDVSHGELTSIENIDQSLRQIAAEQIGKLVLHKINSEANATLLRDLRFNSNPMSEDLATEVHGSITKAIGEMNNRLSADLNVDSIRGKVIAERTKLEESLQTADWKKHFRGRDVLSAFCGKYIPGMRYEYFRNLVLSQMSSANHEPEGMKTVLDQILKD